MFRIPNRIFVGGISQTASQDELREYFAHFGQVKDARIITDGRGNSKGYGFVTYESENDASKVLGLKEEDLVFKESKLNIGHAFRKKNVNGNNGGNMNGGGHMGNNINSYGNGFGIGAGTGASFGHAGLQNSLNGMGSAMMGNSMNQIGMSNQSNGYLGDLQINGMHGISNGGGAMNGYGQNGAMNLPNLNGHLGMNMNGMNMNGLNGMGNLNGLNNMNGMGGGHMSHLHGMNGLNSISPLNGINMKYE